MKMVYNCSETNEFIIIQFIARALMQAMINSSRGRNFEQLIAGTENLFLSCVKIDIILVDTWIGTIEDGQFAHRSPKVSL